MEEEFDFTFEVSEQEIETDTEDEQEEEDTSAKKSQSPWEFAAYSESVAEEHARRSTTSIDQKISKVREEHALQIPSPSDDEDEDIESGSEPEDDNNKQQVLKPEVKEIVDAKSFFSSSDGTSFHANSFMELNLSRPLLRACDTLGYQKPTPIQAACIPLALMGRDICGSAMTGSGKTAAFTLPVLERLLFRPKRIHAIRVLVLTPTRELAVQVHSMIEKLAQFTDIRCCLVVGGLSTKVQEVALRSMPDIVVATPGRMIDHLRNSQSVGLEDLAVLILDEADRLLELGFNAEIRELVRICPKRRQTMLFSATMTEEIDELIKLSLTKPVRLSADPSTKRPATLTEEVVRIRRMREVNQEAVLLALCSKTFTSKVIIFSGTKQAAHRLKILFGLAGFKAAELHGNLTQVQRLDALELFRKQDVDFLIATDVAARGLDIIGVRTVINFACPRDLTSYIHRVGRTARAGKEGYAVTLVSDNDRSVLKSIAKRAGSKLRSRIVAEQSISKWCQMIEKMEDQVAEVLEEEREERILRKAEMEATKAENMIAHQDEIFSRPKRTWFATEKEKRLDANASKASISFWLSFITLIAIKLLTVSLSALFCFLKNSKEKEKNSATEVVSAQKAEDLKMKEKRKREREKNMPRKKRRRLEAAREMLEDENQTEELEQEGGKGKKDKAGKLLVDVAYRQAKAVKAVNKAQDAGKFVKKDRKTSKRPSQRNQSRPEEMRELFQSDMGEKKQRTNVHGGKKKSKSSFKSKSRYE
ncbi:hypothetical protein IFM89_034020 [Coptis chinensis]|uniref:DEAD-box ATP-dependent RNA helicase 28 n=1 Tax=Coptis chinensis TaxID=261450 RepID=A0A835IS12_9MAGN|nr:hypothetical protein IFM89_034020 [Coptis chinensis]